MILFPSIDIPMIWKPNTTVAAVIEKNGHFLMVEEETADGIKINQPAGHLEDGETLLDAVRRETLEETAYEFMPQQLLGVYHWQRTDRDITYLRFAFIGELGQHFIGQSLDQGIIRAVWMSLKELKSSQDIHRSPQVMKCVEDYLSGKAFPLSVLTHL